MSRATINRFRLSKSSVGGRVGAPLIGAAAGIVTGTLEGVIFLAAFKALSGSAWFTSIAFTIFMVSFGIAAFVAVAVTRLLIGPTRRAVRISVEGVQARLANLVGRLANISATGALLSLNGRLPVGSEWPLRLKVDDRPVELWIRVLRLVESVSIESGAMPERQEYAMGVVFCEMLPPARQAIAQLCGDAFDKFQ